jgi:SAM-dependent methyltransferase
MTRLNEDLSVLRDPRTGEPLTRAGDELIAPGGERFPIVGGIPRFVPAENYAADFGAQWKRFPRTQLDSHTGLSISEDRVAKCLGGDLAQLRGQRVLEAGSGAGRFTEVLLKHGALLDSFDFSAAVEANAANNGAKAFTLVQADIRSMPFAARSYDYVVCLGVLQHTPDTEESIAKLWAMVRPGGQLIIDHYRWNLWLRLPPPLGDSEKLYRRLILRLPREKRWPAVKRVVDFWFPIHWRFRHSRVALKLLRRLGNIHFYFGDLPLQSRDGFYEWSLLDSHDGMTDAYKRYRTVPEIRRTLEELGAADIAVWAGGNGVQARCRKPEAAGA